MSSRRQPTSPAPLKNADDVSLDELAARERLEAGSWSREQLLGGLELAKGLVWLIGVVLLLIGLFAGLTYPGRSATLAVRTEWFSEVKDLIQLLVVSLLVPILGTLLGYIFGRNQSRGGNGD